MKIKVWIDHYGKTHYALNITELRKRLGGRCTKLYVDRYGKTYHIGYAIGKLWLYQYERVDKCVTL
jgi:hypothetical protein